MTTSVTLVVSGNKKVAATTANYAGDEISTVIIAPGEHKTILLHSDQEFRVKEVGDFVV